MAAPRKDRFSVWALPAELERWKAAADAAGLSLSAWVALRLSDYDRLRTRNRQLQEAIIELARRAKLHREAKRLVGEDDDNPATTAQQFRLFSEPPPEV